jgi:predicted RNA-binding protein YlxR (DUF448 family)
VPERTCVGCHGGAPKPTLVRVVRGRDGTVDVDPDARASGRGAYLHRSTACLDHALVHGALARALRTSVAAEEARKLRGFIEGVQGNA